MTKTIQEQIKEHEQAIERLKAVEGKVWKPEIGDEFWVITGGGRINLRLSYNGDEHDKGALSIGNCFRTQLEARRALQNLKTIQAIKDWIAENDIDALNLDWNDRDTYKSTFSCDRYAKGVFIEVVDVYQRSLLPHLSSEQKAEACLRDIGEDKIAALYGVYDD